MCDFPSWIEDENGKNWFLTDDDVKVGIETWKFSYWEDAIGHSAIEKMYRVTGKHKEGRRGLPKEFAQAIREGKCNRMARTDIDNAIRFVRNLLPVSFFDGGIKDSVRIRECTSPFALPDNLYIKGDLSLEGSTGLKNLPRNLTIDGFLDLFECSNLTSIPETLNVGQGLFMSDTIKHIKCDNGSLIDIDNNNVEFVLEQLHAEKMELA